MPARIRIQQIATIAFLVYVLVLLSRSALSNAERNEEANAVRTQISELTQKINALHEQIAYQQTTTYKELEARRKLGLKKPGELVIALPPEPGAAEVAAATQSVTTPTHIVLRAWWDYYFAPVK